ncbi:MAG: outer membrane protein assembly factor BamC [Gammaproteobacteria bacterium]|nr:outer membrane protein assembly factor BamC [Gammaproteobacteria bacterium]MCH1549560.1 outer membrane protein assembly factor BamC [Pseudomonadales bacterium]
MRYWLLGTVILSLGACSWMRPGDEGIFLNPNDDYLESDRHNKLVVPEDLRTLENTDPFPIPSVSQPPNPTYYADRPPLPDAIYANDNRDEVRIQTLGDRQWLVIPEPPTTAWPKLKQFLAENAVPIVYDAPQSGRLNTGWLKIENVAYRDVIRTMLKDAKSSDPLLTGQDRFLIKVEQGLRPETTEIHVRHENDSISLPVRDEVIVIDGLNSHMDLAESDLLREVGAYIAAKVSEQTVSKVALQIGSEKKAELERDEDGFPVLYFYLDYERAWATMGQALENASVDIINLDRETGRFMVDVPQSIFTGEEGGGFFCRLTFSCQSDKPVSVQLRMLGSQQKYDLRVWQADGEALLDADVAQQILVLLREFAA